MSSPDIADALVLNFAQDVAPADVPHGAQAKGIISDHDFDTQENINVH